MKSGQALRWFYSLLQGMLCRIGFYSGSYYHKQPCSFENTKAVLSQYGGL
jgi:hypothetical protein